MLDNLYYINGSTELVLTCANIMSDSSNRLQCFLADAPVCPKEITNSGLYIKMNSF